MNPLFCFTLLITCFLQITISPVQLKSFVAVASGCNALLQWTAIDAAGDNYIIESSNDGIIFTTVRTEAADGVDGENIYAVTLMQMNATKWYRLKITGKDSNVIYSRLAAVNIRCNKQPSFSAYPNPVSDYLTISYEAATVAQASIWVNDAAGKTVVKKDIDMQKGANNWQLDVQALLPGLYYVQLRKDDGVAASQKVMKK